MDDKRNLIAAILLSVAILIGWNFVSAQFFPTPAKPDVTTTVAGANGTPATAPATQGQPSALPTVTGPAAPAAPSDSPAPSQSKTAPLLERLQGTALPLPEGLDLGTLLAPNLTLED